MFDCIYLFLTVWQSKMLELVPKEKHSGILVFNCNKNSEGPRGFDQRSVGRGKGHLANLIWPFRKLSDVSKCREYVL